LSDLVIPTSDPTQFKKLPLPKMEHGPLTNSDAAHQAASPGHPVSQILDPVVPDSLVGTPKSLSLLRWLIDAQVGNSEFITDPERKNQVPNSAMETLVRNSGQQAQRGLQQETAHNADITSISSKVDGELT
jgi:hypothetical protein